MGSVNSRFLVRVVFGLFCVVYSSFTYSIGDGSGWYVQFSCGLSEGESECLSRCLLGEQPGQVTAVIPNPSVSNRWLCMRSLVSGACANSEEIYDTDIYACVSPCNISGADSSCSCPENTVLSADGEECLPASNVPGQCPDEYLLVKDAQGNWVCEFADILNNNQDCPTGYLPGTAFRGGNAFDYCAAPPEIDEDPDDDTNQPEVTTVDNDLNTESTTTEVSTTVDNGDGTTTTTTTTTTTSTTTGTQTEESSGSADASGDCHTPPPCTGDSVQCAQLRQIWLLQCKEERQEQGYSGSPDDLYQKESGEHSDRMNAKVTELKSAIESSDVGTAINNFFTFTPPGVACPTYTADIGWASISFDQWCSEIIPWSVIAAVLLAVSTFIAIRIAVS